MRGWAELCVVVLVPDPVLAGCFDVAQDGWYEAGLWLALGAPVLH